MKIDGLTPHQHNVARLVADGMTDKQIAAHLSIDRDTVSFHVRRIVAAWDINPKKNVRVEIAQRMPRARAGTAA